MSAKDKAVKVVDGKFLVSDDNFKTYREENSFEGYTLVSDQNKAAEVVLRYRYGEREAKVLIKEFEKINRLIFSDSPVQKDGYGHAFEVFSIAVLYDLTYEQAFKNHIVGGPNDGKIDAIVPRNGEVRVYQIKMNGTPDLADLDIAKKNYTEFAAHRRISAENAGDLQNFLLRHYDEEYKDKPIRLCSVSTSRNGNNNTPSREVFEKFFVMHLLPQETSNVTLKIRIKQIRDEATGRMVDNLARTRQNTFLFANAEELLDDLVSQGIGSGSDKLFYGNVRGCLGKNEAMQKTIEHAPQKFELYNNGLSVIGEITQSATHIIIKNPIFINGQQTLVNLMIAKEEGKNLEEVVLPVFVKEQADKNERLNIAKYNNTQRQVKGIDLLSLNANLREVQKFLLQRSIDGKFEGEIFFLKLISNGKRNSDVDVKLLFGKNQIIPLDVFVRTYWVCEKGTSLGKWKNNISSMLNAEIVDKEYHFDREKSVDICKIIKRYRDFLDGAAEKDKYRVADVVFMYLLRDYDLDTVVRIVDYLNDEIYPKKNPSLSKLIDMYKSDTIMADLEAAKIALSVQ